MAGDLITFRNATNFSLSINSRTIVLERFLNITYLTEPTDYTKSVLIANGFIYIDNTPSVLLSQYVYSLAEDKPMFINTLAEGDPVFFYTHAEINSGYDFIIQVPAALYSTLELPAFRANVDRYNLCDKKYVVQSY